MRSLYVFYRAFSRTSIVASQSGVNSLDTFSEEEQMFRETGSWKVCWLQSYSNKSLHKVQRFAQDVVAPRVRDMDENEMMDPEVIKGLFETGVRSHARLSSYLYWHSVIQLMGIETSDELGGAGASFTSAILVIEELAKIDPSVSVLCDVHNTLVNTVVRKYGNKEQQEKWLPKLSESSVSYSARWWYTSSTDVTLEIARVLLLVWTSVRVRCLCAANSCT